MQYDHWLLTGGSTSAGSLFCACASQAASSTPSVNGNATFGKGIRTSSVDLSGRLVLDEPLLGSDSDDRTSH